MAGIRKSLSFQEVALAEECSLLHVILINTAGKCSEIACGHYVNQGRVRPIPWTQIALTKVAQGGSRDPSRSEEPHHCPAMKRIREVADPIVQCDATSSFPEVYQAAAQVLSQLLLLSAIQFANHGH
ncbi:MAG: hypothetical protein H6711_14235 [Myxococcales bacterium]|nr:hypothetical protein [Myxococcales bacterium]